MRGQSELLPPAAALSSARFSSLPKSPSPCSSLCLPAPLFVVFTISSDCPSVLRRRTRSPRNFPLRILMPQNEKLSLSSCWIESETTARRAKQVRFSSVLWRVPWVGMSNIRLVAKTFTYQRGIPSQILKRLHLSIFPLSPLPPCYVAILSNMT